LLEEQKLTGGKCAFVDYARKLVINLLIPAFNIIGFAGYAQLVARLFALAPEVLKSRTLTLVDKAMGSHAKKFHYRGSTFLFDCSFCDEHIKDGSYAFGLIREIIIADCYLRFHPEAFKNSKIVVDLGANRGVFSVLMANHAKKIVSVEVQPVFVPVIAHNMAINGFSNYAIETAFVGDGGDYSGTKRSTTTLDELFDKYSLETVDFLKIDIEGSEFGIFRSPSWLMRVKRLSMEVHHAFGSPADIIAVLKGHGFLTIITDKTFRATSSSPRASFIYASRIF
jgi:hypothetical protein